MLFQKIQKILNIDIRKTSALKTRMRMRMSKNAEHLKMRMGMRISDPSLKYTRVERT